MRYPRIHARLLSLLALLAGTSVVAAACATGGASKGSPSSGSTTTETSTTPPTAGTFPYTLDGSNANQYANKTVDLRLLESQGSERVADCGTAMVGNSGSFHFDGNGGTAISTVMMLRSVMAMG